METDNGNTGAPVKRSRVRGRVNARGTEDAIGQVRVRVTLHGAGAKPVRGNISRSVIVDGARVSDIHQLVRAALAGAGGRDPYHLPTFGGEKND